MSENPPGGSVPPQPDEPGQPTPPPPPGGYGPPPGGGYTAPPGGGSSAPPPSGGGYGPPQAGGYGPPQAGGYGPPPGGGYGPPQGAGSADVVMDGVKYGWKKFTENVGPFLIAGVACFVVVGIVIGILYGILFGAAVLAGDSGSDAGFGFGFGIGSILLIAIAALLAAFVQAAFINASLRIAAGQRLDVGDFFRLPNLGNALGTAIIVGIATGIGYALFWLPGAVVALFTMFAIVFALDRGLGPVDAIKASIDLVKNNFVPALLLAIAVYILSAIGSAICGIGILATFPIGVLAVVYVYRKLQNQQVAP